MTRTTIAQHANDIREASESGDASRAHKLRSELLYSLVAHVAAENKSELGQLAGAVLEAVRVKG